jgi:transcriptional regulator with XRE-family HTH domain
MAQTPTPVAAATAANVRAELARAGYTAVRTATALDWSNSRLARRLSGEIPFDIDELTQVAQLLGVPLAAFLPGVAA